MADQKLVLALVATLAVEVLGCSTLRERPRPLERTAPSPKSPAPASTRERQESARPPVRDPSARPPPGYRKMALGGLAPAQSGSAVVLVDDAKKRGLVLAGRGIASFPLGVGRERFGFDRASSGLLAATVRRLGGVIVSVKVDRLEDDLVYGSVMLEKGGQVFELDARPSEALSLGVESEVPVFVAESVLLHAGVDVDKLDFRKLHEARAETPDRSRTDEVTL